MTLELRHGTTVFPWDADLDYSPFVQVGRELVFTSGQGPFGPDGAVEFTDDPAAQMRLTFDNLRAVLAAAGSDLSDVVTLTVYLTRSEDFPLFKSIRREYFSAPFPAVTTVRADLLDPAMLIELHAVARTAGSDRHDSEDQ